MSFKIQVPTEIVRNNKINALEFVLLSKLIQAYYLCGKVDEFELDHKNLMYLLNIGDNNTFKKVMNKLFVHGYLLSEIKSLPRKGAITVKMNVNVIPELNKNMMFTQLTKDVLHKSIIDTVGYIGVRLIYYYQSYINHKEEKKNHCYAAEETIAFDIGITKKTVIEYNKKLSKNKFVKIVSHDLNDTGEYVRKDDNEIIYYNKYNNHYFVKEDKISEFVSRNQSL